MIHGTLPDSVPGLWLDQKSLWENEDTLQTSSDYSTCEESDAERYCSANSVIGTASICSSIGSHNDFCISRLGSSMNLQLEWEDSVSKTCNEPNFEDKQCGISVHSDSYLSDEIESSGEPTDAKVVAVLDEVTLSPRAGREPLSLRTAPSSGTALESREEASAPSGIDNWFKTSQSSAQQYGGNKASHNSSARIVGPGSDFFSSYSGDFMLHNTAVIADNNGNAMFSIRKTSISSDEALRDSYVDASPGESKSICNFSQQVEGDVFPNFGVSFKDCAPAGGEVEIEPGACAKSGLRREHAYKVDLVLDYGTYEEDTYHARGKTVSQYRKTNMLSSHSSFITDSVAAVGIADWDNFEEEAVRHSLPNIPSGSSYTQYKEYLPTDRFFSEQAGEMENAGSVQCTVSTTCEEPDLPDSAEAHKNNLVGDLLLIKGQSEPGGCSYPYNYMSNNEENVEDQIMTGFCIEKAKGLGQESSGKTYFTVEPLSNHTPYFQANVASVNEGIGCQDYDEPHYTSEEGHVLDEANNPAFGEFCEELVHDMEQILLGSTESCGFERDQNKERFFSPCSRPFRDGSSMASTAGAHGPFLQTERPSKLDWVEVVGAKQRKGDVSLGERLVGVREHTVYTIRVWKDKDRWETERRYREFLALYSQLRAVFSAKGLKLPFPWSNVERESRRIFGNVSPNLVNERSSLIQECLQSMLLLEPSVGMPNCLFWFLSSAPHPVSSNFGTLGSSITWQSVKAEDEEHCPSVSALGKTISLHLDLQPCKSVKKLAETQNYACFGCHKNFKAGKTFMKEFAQTLGWGKPRLCEYTGKLFCAACHTSDRAILPAHVLHLWDFIPYPVCQMARIYLESIYDQKVAPKTLQQTFQPMLCISAVNPFLFSKVPALLHVMNIRKKFGEMLPYVRCSFRKSVQRSLGSRRYLLEATDFFALRDLVDLSRGAFATLPAMMETLSDKIYEHIMQQCLICCDVAVACGARKACDNLSFLIFPFQKDEITRCPSCGSSFHKHCYEKLTGCPCAFADSDSGIGASNHVVHEAGDEVGFLNVSSIPDDKTSKGFFSDLFSKSKLEILWGARNSSHIILMGSMPSTE